MKKIIILMGAAAIIFSSCGKGSGSLKTEQDSLAYAVGLDLGNYIKNMDSTINIDVVASAIKDVISNKQKMDQEASYAFLREYFTVRRPAKAKIEGEQFLASVEKENKKIQKTADGLLYEIINAGSDVKATDDTDTVKVVYHGTLKSGKVFDSSKERGDTATFSLNRVIKGWSEGMKLVGKGGSIKLWIPAALAYGENGMGQAIGPNEPLVFEIDVVDVAPAAASAAIPAATK